MIGVHARRADIDRAVRRLRRGGLVAFPTETVYGLGALARDARAVAGVFHAKGRPRGNPLIVHVADAAMARAVASAWPASAAALAERFWPGPLTIVLPKARDIPDEVTAGGRTVAVRCPDHPVALALLEALGEPLVGPSANRSGGVSPTRPEHVRAAFPASEVLVLDGGRCERGIESTVVDLTQTPLRVLRPGFIGPAEIAGVAGAEVEVGSASAGPARSPGLLPVHYAPGTPARLIDPKDLEATLAALPEGSAAVVLGPADLHIPQPHMHRTMPEGAEAYAACMYEALRESDNRRAALVVVVRPWGPGEPEGLWAAIADRLGRATAPR